MQCKQFRLKIPYRYGKIVKNSSLSYDPILKLDGFGTELDRFMRILAWTFGYTVKLNGF